MGLQRFIRSGARLKGLKTRLYSSSAPGSWFVEPVKSRTLLKVFGDEVKEYLQGLITNDMNHMNDLSESLYTMFLNSKGRVLYDAIIYKTNDPKMYIIEGDSSALDPLKKHLLMYRVRRKINVESANDLNLWVISKDINLAETNQKSLKTFSSTLKPLLESCLVVSDPRIPDLGVRIVAPKELNLTSVLGKFPDYQPAPEHFYKSLRYKLGIGEGIAELPPGHSFPLEANCDYLNGVSFWKGCYIGQELTARTYHTGVVRKRLMPITLLEGIINSSEVDIKIASEDGGGKPVGKLRGVEGMTGIALLRIEEALKSSKLAIQDKLCITSRPHWWPNQSATPS